MSKARVAVKANRVGSIKGMDRRIEDATPRIVQRFAQAVVRESRLRAPVRTGALKKSIKAHRLVTGTWLVRVGAHYGIYVEYGTRNMRAQPYFTPGINAAKKVIRDEWHAVIGNTQVVKF